MEDYDSDFLQFGSEGIYLGGYEVVVMDSYEFWDIFCQMDIFRQYNDDFVWKEFYWQGFYIIIWNFILKMCFFIFL